MTDTVSPITGPHLTPMFATGAQPEMSPNTEPHHAPIFDTGPHPDPLRLAGRQSEPVAGPELAAQPEPAAEPALAVSDSAAPEAPGERASVELASVDPDPEAEAGHDIESDPAAQAGFEAEPVIAPDPVATPETPQAFSALDNDDTDAFLRSVTGHMPAVVPAQPVVVPGAYQFVKRWKFALIVSGVWVLAAAAGLGFYFWWYTSLTKTVPVFGILLFMVICMVASLLVSMVPNRPQVSALAIALMAAPLASTAAAAVLHGAYYFEWMARPVIG
jgi:hypothetical protein